jgi:hypothetical protein
VATATSPSPPGRAGAARRQARLRPGPTTAAVKALRGVAPAQDAAGACQDWPVVALRRVRILGEKKKNIAAVRARLVVGIACDYCHQRPV